MSVLANKLNNISVPNVINLKECLDRREYTIAEFAKLGISTIKMHSYDRY